MHNQSNQSQLIIDLLIYPFVFQQIVLSYEYYSVQTKNNFGHWGV